MNNIKKMRDAKGLTQNELSSLLKVSQSTVAMWETGESMPRASLLPKISAALGCSIDDLFKSESDQKVG